MDLDEFRRAAARKELRETGDPLGVVRQFLRAYCSDADGLDEVREHIARVAKVNPRPLDRVVAAIDRLLVTPLPAGALAQLVASDANWVVEDTTDAGAGQWLAELAAVVRTALPA